MIIAIDKLTSTTEVILAKTTGTGASEKTTYSKWIFDNTTGYSTDGKSTTLTIDQILAKEATLNTDLTDDDIIGNGIVQVLPDSGTSGLYTMSSGSYVFSTAGQNEGNIPTSTVTLKTKTGTGWTPATGESVVGINDLGTTTDAYLAKKTGSGATSATTYSKWNFTDATGNATGTSATTLSTLEMLAAEKTLTTDLNGDGVLGNAIIKTLATHTSASSSVYQMTEGYALSASGQAVSSVPTTATILKDKAGKSWAPATGESVVGINDLGTTTDVYLAKKQAQERHQRPLTANGTLPMRQAMPR